jgi:hypothetical protein
MSESTVQPLDESGLPIPKSGTYLRPRQVEAMEDEARGLEETLADPRARLENRGEVQKLLGRVKRDLETQRPPETTPEQRDKLAREEKSLREEMCGVMPSQEEMRKSPPGAVGKEMRFQKDMKEKMLRWKNIQLLLNPGSDDPDVANFERFRPRTSTLNMDNAQIPGQMFFNTNPSQAYLANFDKVFGTDEERAEREAEQQRLQEENEALKAKLAELQPKAPKKPKPENKYDATCKGCGRVCSGTTQNRANLYRDRHQVACKEYKALQAA